MSSIVFFSYSSSSLFLKFGMNEELVLINLWNMIFFEFPLSTKLQNTIKIYKKIVNTNF